MLISVPVPPRTILVPPKFTLRSPPIHPPNSSIHVSSPPPLTPRHSTIANLGQVCYIQVITSLSSRYPVAIGRLYQVRCSLRRSGRSEALRQDISSAKEGVKGHKSRISHPHHERQSLHRLSRRLGAHHILPDQSPSRLGPLHVSASTGQSHPTSATVIILSIISH